jgi:hypothetical protein
MLLVDSARHVYWRYPIPARAPAMPFRFGDDTFFGPHTDRIVSNQEDQHTIQIISFPAGRVLWRYGHVNVKGSAAGYLNTPDDAYLLRNGLVTVADAYNCRVLFISPAHRVVRQYGTTGVCRHNPPALLGPINGATPLADGGTLVSEIKGSWIDDIGPDGRLRWTVQAPVSYPSDPQLLSPKRILVADYARPGHALIMTPAGRVLWKYGPASGPGELDHPSLATRIAPDLIAINDDYRHRVVLVSIRTRQIVWQYGQTDVAGRADGLLNTPDGLDLLPTSAAQASPTLRTLLRPQRAPTGAPSASAVTIGTPYRLSAPVEREVAAWGTGGVLLAGGLDAAGQSTNGVFLLDPQSGRLRSLGTVPQPFHDAAGALLGSRLLVFGGGTSQSSAAVQAFDTGSRTGSVIGRLPRALSDLASATIGRVVYLLGGYDGTAPRAEIYRTTDGIRYTVAGRLKTPLRYPAVTAFGSQIVIAGGVGAAGPSNAVWEFDPRTGASTLLGRLPRAVGHASAVTLGKLVYVVGGKDGAGRTVESVTRIDPAARTVTSTPGSLGVADAATATAAGRALVIGGSRSGRATASVWELR